MTLLDLAQQHPLLTFCWLCAVIAWAVPMDNREETES